MEGTAVGNDRSRSASSSEESCLLSAFVFPMIPSWPELLAHASSPRLQVQERLQGRGKKGCDNEKQQGRGGPNNVAVEL